ncbi:aldehyde dehydrogenase [Alteribacter natronophilus]|uniref:aldehyde dehydrogenase n=1 Tax=Alteribacter natronophilus TaxID=2583810 RepID=UPI00110E344B|nr:aldehyde dehydrogenase [Alteribacter natronophilus]TMW71258.1 aldehyde dehydrogenase [Alteribacter natronophilus]
MKTYEFYINGSFTGSSNGETLSVTSPADGQAFAEVPAGTKEDVTRVTGSARQAFKKWKKLATIERAAYIDNLIELLRDEENQKRIGRAISMEMGKPLSHAIGEVGAAAEIAAYQNQWARRIEGDIVDADSSSERILLYKEPIGTVLCITPWNFPMYVLFRKMVPALLAGNTVIAKPSFKSAVSALELAPLLKEAGFPDGVVNVITGRDEEIGDALTSNENVGMVTFTGSTGVGKHVAAQAATHVARTSLELGGKAPAVVMKDADLDLAAQAIAGGRLANSGQVCNNTERVYVHASVKDELAEKLKEQFSSYQVGNGIDNPDVDMGPLVSEEDGNRIHGIVEKAREQGAEVLTGGHFLDGLPKSFYPPTLLDNCTQDMDVVRDEVFGPVLPIVTFETIDEAIDMANDSIYGLTANVYTNDYRSVMRLTTELESGEVYVNRQQGEAFQGYHTGWKQSGIGGDDGRYGFEAFLQKKSVYMNFE